MLKNFLTILLSLMITLNLNILIVFYFSLISLHFLSKFSSNKLPNVTF